MRFALLFLCFFSLEVLANLMIAPLRVKFDDRERVKELFIVNNSDAQQTYRVSLEDKAALVSGGYTTLSEPSASSASNLLRFSPRQFSLEPGQSQKIKIMARRPSSLPVGEYRSHLALKSLPVANPDEDETEVTGTNLELNILLNYSLPVIVRKGAPSDDFNISNMDIVSGKSGSNAVVTLQKIHNYSGYGTLKVFWKGITSSTEKQVGIMNEFKFFHELNEAKASVFLPNFSGERGYYRVEFTGLEEFKGKTLAEFETRI